MGTPSNKRRSALRPGKSERALRKKHRRGSLVCYVGGAGIVRGIVYSLKTGRKKYDKVRNYLDRLTHLGGESETLKSGTVIKRPLYTITVS